MPFPAPRTDLDAPLPLGWAKALERACELRLSDPSVYTWRVIARIMQDFHGVRRSRFTWEKHIKARLPDHRRPRGNYFVDQRVRRTPDLMGVS